MSFPRPARIFLVILSLILAAPAVAQDNPFAGSWVLQSEGSTLGFQSVKNDTKVEQNNFAKLSGEISEAGLATVRVALDSIDTKIDLRNVRMRFLFFETFKFPEAVVTAQIDPALIADLPTKRRVAMKLPYTLDLHGVKLQQTADVMVTLISDTLVDVSSVGTIPIAAADFALNDGVTKLQEAANVKIVPTGSVTFDWLFARTGAAPASSAAVPETTADATTPPVTAALETTGDFDPEACAGRLEILSHAGNINFRYASATLNVAGSAILNDLVDIINRCPGLRIELGGHTDNDGSDATNQALSEKRAKAVMHYLISKGINADRLVAQGYGESQPLVANDSKANMARNRRIEFKVLN